MAEPLRVLLVLTHLHGGGAERVAVHLANRCDPERFDVRLGLLRRAGSFLAEADPARIDVAPVARGFLDFEGRNSGHYRPDKLAAAIALAPISIKRMIRARQPHVVMSFLKGVSLLTWMAVNRLGPERPAWIVREGNNTDAVIDDELSNPAARAVVRNVTRRAYRSADCFLANSNEMAAGLTNRLSLDPSRVRVVHNPVDIVAVQRIARTGPPRREGRPYIVTVGRLEYQKGHDILLRAFAEYGAAATHDLVIIGRGSREAELKSQAAALGLADRVTFVGFEDNPWRWVAGARLFVLPSRWEGFPTALVEALACGAPSLVTACDFGPAEVVEHGRSGWVVPPEDVGAFGKAMADLLASPERLADFADAGPRRAAQWDIDPMIRAYEDLFAEQAGGRLPVRTLRKAA
jgi:glycosyltransferase involved in cell wall biosynthesis